MRIIKKKTEEKNYCEICGLKIKIVEEIAGQNEELFRKLNTLGLRKRKEYRRLVSMTIGPSPEPSFSEFCAIGSRKWINKGNNCKSFQLKLSPLSLSDYISIHVSNKNIRSQNKLLVAGIFISIVALLALIFTNELRAFLIDILRQIFN